MRCPLQQRMVVSLCIVCEKEGQSVKGSAKYNARVYSAGAHSHPTINTIIAIPIIPPSFLCSTYLTVSS